MQLVRYRSAYPTKPTDLLLAPSGVDAININGITVLSGLDIPCRGKLLLLNDLNKVELISKNAEVELFLIGKI